LATLLHDPKLYTLKSLAKIVAEISRGSENSGGASLAQPLPILVQKLLLARFFRNPSCAPNLKLLSLTVVEISSGSQNFGGAPLAQIPPILVQIVDLACYSPKHKLYNKFEVASFNGCKINRGGGVAKLGCAKCGRTPHLYGRW